jgi:hypothetical protein
MQTGFLPKIEEADERKNKQKKSTEIDISVVEKNVKGKKMERLKLPSIEKIVELVEEQRGFLSVLLFF